LEILWMLYAGIGAHQQPAVMKAPHHEDRQRYKGSAQSTRDNVCGRRDIADIEFDLPDHPTVSADLRHDSNEVRLDTFDRNGAAQDGRRVRILADSKIELDFIGHEDP